MLRKALRGVFYAAESKIFLKYMRIAVELIFSMCYNFNS